MPRIKKLVFGIESNQSNTHTLKEVIMSANQEMSHCWFSSKQAEMVGYIKAKMNDDRIITYTCVSETMEHGCFWDDMVYLGSFPRNELCSNILKATNGLFDVEDYDCFGDCDSSMNFNRHELYLYLEDWFFEPVSSMSEHTCPSEDLDMYNDIQLEFDNN